MVSRCACIQLRSSDDVTENLENIVKFVREAAHSGADFILTPENSNYLDIRGGASREQIVFEQDDVTLDALKGEARRLGVWLQIGSLAIRLEEDKRLANRGFLITPEGQVLARYDKIHMFDVDVGDGQTYRESRGYRPGEMAKLVKLPFAKVGMSICYDLRFPHLYRSLSRAGANLLTIPAAFTQTTGEAHWHVLLRARAIENGAFVMAAAQGGKHRDGRSTYGHSMIISPWGEIIAEADQDPGIIYADLDFADVETVRKRVPSILNSAEFELDCVEANKV